MTCRIENPKAHGRVPLDEIRPENVESILRQIVISREVHRILSTTKVSVQAIDVDKKTSDERIIQDLRGVQHLDRIEFMTAAEMLTRRARHPGAALGTTETRPAVPEPFRKHLFELQFTAHYSVVPEVVRRLTASREFFLVIARMDVRRQPQAFGDRSRGGWTPGARTATPAITGEERMLMNSRENEAPVIVVLECEVFEFDFDAVAETEKGSGRG